MKCVTTFSPEGYIEYGERFLRSYVHHVPLPIVAYVEETPPFEHELIEYRKIYGIPGIAHFLNQAEKNPRNYLYDAGKFCHKVYAQIDMLEKEEGEIFWFDADVVFFADVSPWLLKGLLKDVCLAYLGRNVYSETGFIGFNKSHKDIFLFMNHYRDMYEKRKIYELEHHTDCHAFDAARKGIMARDLTSGRGLTHVYCKSPLAAFSDHLKGQRKELGYSPEHPSNEQIRTVNQADRTATA